MSASPRGRRSCAGRWSDSRPCCRAATSSSGDAVGVADVAAFPFLKYGVLYDPDDDEVFHRILIEHLALGDEHPRVAAWIARMDALPRA